MGSDDPDRSFDLQGHRGARGLAPENTLVAFARALSLGRHDPRAGHRRSRATGRWWSATTRPSTPTSRAGRTGRGWKCPARRNLLLDPRRAARGTTWAASAGHALRAQFSRPGPGGRDAHPDPARGLRSREEGAATRGPVQRRDQARPGQAGTRRLRPMPSRTRFSPSRASAGGPRPHVDPVVDWRTLVRVQKVAPAVLTCYPVRAVRRRQIQAGRPGPSPWLAGFDVDDFGGSVPRLVQAAGGRCWSPSFRDLRATPWPKPIASGCGSCPGPSIGLRTSPRSSPSAWTGLISDRPDLARRAMQAKGTAASEPTPVEP